MQVTWLAIVAPPDGGRILTHHAHDYQAAEDWAIGIDSDSYDGEAAISIKRIESTAPVAIVGHTG